MSLLPWKRVVSACRYSCHYGDRQLSVPSYIGDLFRSYSRNVSFVHVDN